MSKNPWIFEINKQKFTIETTNNDYPAIYKILGNGKIRHIYKSVGQGFDINLLSDMSDCVLILARKK